MYKFRTVDQTGRVTRYVAFSQDCDDFAIWYSDSQAADPSARTRGLPNIGHMAYFMDDVAKMSASGDRIVSGWA